MFGLDEHLLRVVHFHFHFHSHLVWWFSDLDSLLLLVLMMCLVVDS
jgi:hypothetical protein